MDRLLNSQQQYELKNVMKSDQTAFATVIHKPLCEVLTKPEHALKTVIKQLPPSVCVIVSAVTTVYEACVSMRYCISVSNTSDCFIK